MTITTKDGFSDSTPPRERARKSRWAIVLAGGEGVRMRSFAADRLGVDCPKQYCTFIGSRSLLRHTVDRASSVVAPEHIVTVIGRGHARFLTQPGNCAPPGPTIEQPGNLDTAPGVFLPTAYVLEADPQATLILFPSDHFVYPEERFLHQVDQAFEFAELLPDRLILVGAVPDSPEPDYGWIAPKKAPGAGHATPVQRRLMSVASFHEKPSVPSTLALFLQGCLWNTMVIAVKARTLWELGRQCFPRMLDGFDAFRRNLRALREEQADSRREATALAALYKSLSPSNFSRDFLQCHAARASVLPLDGVAWCDWGRPHRVVETLVHLQRGPRARREDAGKALAPLASLNVQQGG